MPTEVTPAPFRYQQQYPLSLEHPRFFASSLPISGPPRAAHLLNGPGSVLPNGLRNPWAPYAGETYRPSAEAAANIQATSLGGGGVYAPRFLGGGNSVVGGVGGLRSDDGWDGSLGRNHIGHAPDMTSTAGAIPRLQTGSWLNQPSSWQNHARMTPSVALSTPGGFEIPAARAVVNNGHLAPVPPTIERSHTGSRAVPINGHCEECYEHGGRPRSSSGGSQHDLSRRVSQSRHRKPFVESPLKHSEDLVRKSSGRSARSGRECSECSRGSR